ncbi:OmpA family protein [Danxiaibacter flavus]|uniref:OmpA family protein n=1 Tax=Danxiaibacter flavus TaxID=3049108 RepID=A0ABV3ZK08_9BACT|nr:OmpA family protein [Chitinophagaceae bacterium DXS]
MSFNLIESVKGLISGDLISKAASTLGESEGGIQKLINGAVPVSIASMIQNATNSSDGGAGLLDTARQVSRSGVLGNPGSLFSGNTSSVPGLSGIMESLFDGNFNSISNALSSFAGVRSSSASSILSMVVPVVLGVFGKHAIDNNLSATDATSFLASQKLSLLSSLPPGLDVAGMLGISSLSSLGSKISGGATTVADTAQQTVDYAAGPVKKGDNWVMPLLLVLIAAALIWYFLKGNNKASSGAVTVDTTTVVTPPVTTPILTLTRIKVRLPNGKMLNAYTGGIEDKLVAYLNSNEAVSKDKWFDFDNVNFKTGTTGLTDSSQQQIQNIAEILKAYPKVKVKVGGYTDKTGDSIANQKLSQSRAETIASAIKTAGANAQQVVGAEGYGSHFATVDASASDEARKVDRRMALNVREK